MFDKIDPALLKKLTPMLERAGSSDQDIAFPAQREIAKALVEPLRKAVLIGDNITNIFVKESYTTGSPEYTYDLINPGAEGDFVAYTMPSHGRIPMRRVESDRIMLSTYRIANSIDCLLSFIRKADWNVVGRMIEILEMGFRKKRNDDGWTTLISAGTERGSLVYDADASAGLFTPRLVSLGKTFMRRNGGGNSTSINRGKLTDLYVSPEAKDDVRSWGLNLVPDAVRANIYYSSDNGNEIMKIHDVNLHDLDELGVDQQYQRYYTSTLSATMASGDTEIAIGLDLSTRSSFVMPVTKELELFEDKNVHREGLFSMYGDEELGFGALDLRKIVLMSF